MSKVFTRRFIFQLFGIASIFLFLLSNLFQPNYWAIKDAGAVSDGFGISLDDNASYSTSLNAHIINDGPTPAGPQTVQMGVFHCNTAGTAACAPDLTPNDMASDSQGVTSLTVDLPAPGTSTRTNISVPMYSCGRVQVDFGWPGHSENGGIVGGRVFDLGSNCAAPVPTPKTASLSSSCPASTPTLTANWNVGSGSSCNIYVRAGSTDSQISTNCSGSATLTSLPQSGAVVNGGIYQLFASDGTTTTDGGQTTLNCAAPAPSASPAPSQPPAPTCPYGSTQARWQANTSDPWGSSKTINVGQSANAGSFHDATGQFASDTTLTVTGPGTTTTLTNGQAFTPSQAGSFNLTVTTNGFSGGGCTDTATLTVNAVAAECPFTSTQARVQRNLEDPWASSKTINLGDQIRVGGFHNGTGLFAEPGTIALSVTGPQSFSSVGNGTFVTPAQAGNFTLTATTPNGSGPACTDTASFAVLAASPTPTPSPTLTPTPGPSTTPTPTPSATPTPTPSIAPTPTPTPAGGPTTITVNPTITSTNTNTNSQSQTVNVTQQQTGNVGVAGVATTAPGVKVTELPKTGLPALAWSALAFLPAGFSLKKFKGQKINKEVKDKPDYIWTHRRFRT